jgi:hypothetical protein
MCRPPLPTTTPLKHACRPEWDLTAFAQLSAEQSYLRSSPGHLLTKGRWSEPGGSSLELPDRKFQAKSEADTPTTGEVRFTPQLQVIVHDKLPASLRGKRETLDGEEFACMDSRDGFPVKKVRFSFCTSEIATSSPCPKRISRESKNLGENAKTKIASEKTKNWAGATPLLTAFSRPNQSGVAPARPEQLGAVSWPRAGIGERKA